jgi:hypothetical protein
MSDQDTIFNNDSTPTTDPNDNALPDQLAAVVGEGKKYGTVEEALKSIQPAQEHISKIESENAALRAQVEELNTKVATGAQLDQVLQEISASKEPPAQQAPTVDPQAIDKVVDARLAAAEQVKLKQTNRSAVISELNSKFGSKAEEVYRKVAGDVGLTVAQLNALAESSPTAALAYFANAKGEEQRPAGTVTTDSLNQDPNQNKAPDKAKLSDGVDLWRQVGDEVRRKYGIEN